MDALFVDGDVEVVAHTLGSGTVTWPSGGAFSRTVQASEVVLREVTHVRGRVWPQGADPDSGAVDLVHVSAPYPPGAVGVDVGSWVVDPDTGAVTYDVALRWWGAGGHGRPCEGYCSWRLDGWYRDGGQEWLRHTFGSGTLTGYRWTFERSFSGQSGALAAVTHVRAYVWPQGGGIADGYTYEAALPPYQLAALSDADYQALMAFAPDFGLQVDPASGLLLAVSIGHLARAVCAAAEIEILRGGESQGTQYANSSMTTTQVSLQHLCFALVGLTAAAVTATVPPLVGGFDPADPPLYPGPWPHPRPETYPDGAGGNGNWPNTAAGGFCDDGETPPEHQRTHPLDIDTSDLTPAARQDVITYARLVNSWLAKVGPTMIISPTQAGTRTLARTAAAAARTMAEDTFDAPFAGHAGHVPDTALTGTPYPPCGWLDMDPAANRRAGAVLRHRVGQVVTHITVDGILP